MLKRALRQTAVILFVVMACQQPSWGEQLYLYTPKEVTSAEKGQDGNGVLVQDVPVQKGDTLYGISRKFSGRGMYYPQILLFNNIKNPNLIYTGDTLKVPVSQQATTAAPEATSTKPGKRAKRPSGAALQAAVPDRKQTTTPPAAAADAVAEIPASELKKADLPKQKRRSKNARQASQASAAAPVSAAAPSQEQSAATGQKLFERAVKAFRQDDYKSALELFDRYLADNPNSALAADASLYKAECYLKLSAQ